MASQVSERGQITVDRAIRAQLGIRPGMLAYQRIVDGRLEVVFLPAPHHDSQFGVFHREGEPARLMTPDDLEEAVMEAIDEEVGRTEGDDA